MLLRYSLGLEKEAGAIESAVRTVLDDKDVGGLGLRTSDLGGNVQTTEIGDAIMQQLRKLL
jgi:3-isopropylmalate dehydrogenase